MLSELQLKDTYKDTRGDNLLEDFYIPCLSNSSEYTRIVGYFSPSVFLIAARGLSAFLQNEGKINLLFIKCEKFILIILEYKHVI